MTSPLIDQIAKEVAEELGPILIDGELRRTISGGFNQFNDPIPLSSSIHDFKGYRDEFSDFARSNGIPDTQYIIAILAQTIDVKPDRGDQILFRGQWSQVEKTHSIDPATALYQLRCYDIDDPTL